MRVFRAALSMLTCLPVGRDLTPTDEEIARTPFYFPLIGLLTGLVLAGIGAGLQKVFPPLVCAALFTFLSEFPTRAFHLDGLADTADGFLSSRPRERILEIMHDSRIGTMGVLAIGFWGLVKFAAFCALPPQLIPAALLLMSLNGRCVMVYHLMCCRYARPAGLGRLVFERRPTGAAVLSLLCTAGAAWAVLPPTGLILPGIMLVFGILWSLYTRWKIGGGTGDTLGAAEELAELVTLLTLTALP